MIRCTKDLRTHAWQNREHFMLSGHDCEGFYECFLIWECCWCARRVWADGMLHRTTPALSPVQWEEITRTHDNPWQRQVERQRRDTRQQEYFQAHIAQATFGAHRS